MTSAAADLAEHIEVARRAETMLPSVEEVAERLVETFASGGRVLTFGNGGSATQAQHLATELTGRYRLERAPLPAFALSADGSLLTCIGNDYAFDEVFARQVRAHVQRGDMVIGLTTSGSSPNVVAGLRAARERGATTVLFGGGGPAAEHADLVLQVPSETTARVQEMHLLLLHLIAERVDEWAMEQNV